MKTLIKATLVLTILIALFIKVYAPLMDAEDSRTFKTTSQESLNNLSVKEDKK